MLGRGYISHYSEYALSSTLSIFITFITLIAFVLKENNATYATVNLNVIYVGADGMQM